MSNENKFEQDLINRATAEAKIAALAMEDPAFREKLLADPKAALTETVGLQFPEALKVVVHEESADTLHMVIPPALPEELSDEQLEAVAGGAVFTATAIVAGIGVAASVGTSIGVGAAADQW